MPSSISRVSLFAMAAAPIALALARWFLPTFDSLSGKHLTLDYSGDIVLIAAFIGMAIVVGFLSGLVPASFMAGVPPNRALREWRRPSAVIPILRRGLVVVQFTLSIAFMTIAIFMTQQVNFMLAKDPGLSYEDIVNIALGQDRNTSRRIETCKRELQKHPGVLAITASAFTPGSSRYTMNYRHAGTGAAEFPMIDCLPVDSDFISTYKLQIVEGRDFSAQFPTDKDNALIINEAAKRHFNWSSAIGKSLAIGNWKQGTVIGVVKDFHFESMHREIAPLVLAIDPESYEYLSVRIDPTISSQTLAFIQERWRALLPQQSFSPTYFRDDLHHLYKTEMRLKDILTIVTLLAILIASLGLFGLSAFTATRRSTEIAVRKILGASTHSLLGLLTRDFARWIVLANLIAWPIAYVFTRDWLQNFPFHIPITLSIFFISGLSALIIAMATVSYQTIRVVKQNPAHTLRHKN